MRVDHEKDHTGEIYCVLDEDEILPKPFDTVIVQGVNQAGAIEGPSRAC